jgi:hypothetical protein
MVDVLIDTIRTIDEIFIRLAEAGTVQDWVDLDLVLAPLDDVVEEMWTALESGGLRLVVDGDRLLVEPFEGPAAARLLVAEQQWPLIAARRRVLCGLYEPQGAGVHG